MGVGRSKAEQGRGRGQPRYLWVVLTVAVLLPLVVVSHLVSPWWGFAAIAAAIFITIIVIEFSAKRW